MTEPIIEIFQSQIHGRGIRATRDIKAGELLLQDTPFAYVLCHTDASSDRCDYCFHNNKKTLRKCMACKFVRYCDKKCQVAAWPDHKLECKGIKKAEGKTFDDNARLMAKIQWKRKQLLGDSPTTKADADGFPTIPDLLHKHDQLSPTVQKEFEESFAQISHLMKQDQLQDRSKMRELYSIYAANRVSIPDESGQRTGTGLYLKTSLMNHSCDCNCAPTFIETTLYVRAIRDIKKGEECFHSYVAEQLQTHERKNLLSGWNITCSCALCRDKERDSRKIGFRCGNYNCSSGVPFFMENRIKPSAIFWTPPDEVKCVTCSWFPGAKRVEDEYWPAVRKMEKNQALIEMQKQSRDCDWSIVKALAESSISMGEKLFFPQNYMIQQTITCLITACEELKLFDEVIKYELKDLQITKYEHLFQYGVNFSSFKEKELHPKFHPTIGRKCYRLGWHYQCFPLRKSPPEVNIAEGKKWLLQAVDNLHVTHGDDHPLMAEAKEQLHISSSTLSLLENNQGCT